MRLISLRITDVQAALAAAVLFGAGTPIAKLQLTDVSPWMLAGLLVRDRPRRVHTHVELTHAHEHYPDSHHRHSHPTK